MNYKIKNFFLLLLIFYQKVINPIIGKNCRNIPSCSEYAIKKIYKFNLAKYTYLVFKRIFRCHSIKLSLFNKHSNFKEKK
ncbi:membrane protein insertion efficiency factor YidD [bacterium endosymbiont of Pedicinus badii]|uniref:membrane protein insertion efficiency factor YidD n=1 Tax=bacterium endosymbiont of Pedicinus badii TaxID=1719126 RepID=UPI0009C9C694|nr:membrane protein insertion efficiency factor YidD [bacterium endosymbiont of Pedicinus badii]OQM34259.1 hypothetical protein AOQ89_01795 [bacterium endosymbiont of Pedicinus badii]